MGWTADVFPTKDPKDEQWVLKGGSFLDSLNGDFNHKATVVTRMGNTADSGSQNTGFRCAAGKGGGGKKRPPSQEAMHKVIEEKGVEGLQEWLAQQGQDGMVMTPAELQKRQDEMKKFREEEFIEEYRKHQNKDK